MSKQRNKQRFHLSKAWIIFISIIVFLIVIRLILPSVILKYANDSLASMENYTGHIDDIDLAIYRGAYKINDISIDQVDSATGEQTPFFSSSTIDLSLEWRALFSGKIVGELRFENPVLIFTKDKVEPKEVQQDTTDFSDLLDNLMPLRINKFEINNGLIKYKDESTTPLVDIQMDEVYVVAENLTSVKDTSLLPATVFASANVYQGHLNVNLKIDPLADSPTFDLNAELTETRLPEFNEFFKAYGNMDVSSGTFGLYTEVAAKEGKFTGYVKPVIHNLEVLGPEDKDKDFLNKLWEGAIDVVGNILENPKEDQIAAKVPIEGSFDDTTVETWYAIATVLRNAFIQALYPSLDNQISIGSVDAEVEEEKKGLLQRIFKGDEDKDEKKDKD